ncbi:MAG: hypothetical protein M1318_06765, partial [Firmicutes bacterium]|nr:hypothetical protein [Bacillota bacterium]
VVLLYVTEMVRGRFPGPRLPMSYEREMAQAIEAVTMVKNTAQGPSVSQNGPCSSRCHESHP